VDEQELGEPAPPRLGEPARAQAEVVSPVASPESSTEEAMSGDLSPIYRLPDQDDLNRALRGDENEKSFAIKKLKKAIQRVWDQLRPDQQKQVEVKFSGTVQTTKVADFLTSTFRRKGFFYPDDKLLYMLIAAIKEFGTPGLTIHPGYGSDELRAMTPAEKANLDTMINSLAGIVDEIVNGKHDKRLQNVFGSAAERVKDAKERFVAGFKALQDLRQGDKIGVDALNKEKVWGCGGLTTPDSMNLPDSVLAKVDPDGLTTLAHEMTHAIPNNRNTGDTYYRHHAIFKIAQEDMKVITAAYYEEVVWQVLNPGRGATQVAQFAEAGLSR
jgi:hypothetical protein